MHIHKEASIELAGETVGSFAVVWKRRGWALAAAWLSPTFSHTSMTNSLVDQGDNGQGLDEHHEPSPLLAIVG